jgi:hypothetical protein
MQSLIEATAKETAQMLIRHHIGIIFGCPGKIVSDSGGAQCTIDFIKELMMLFLTDYVLTLAGSKQEDGQEFLRSYLLDRRLVLYTSFASAHHDS